MTHSFPPRRTAVLLADLGYAPRLVENEARERRRLIVRQVPFELAVEVADRDRAVDDEAAVGLRPHAGDGQVVLVGDIADDRSEEHTSELQSLMRISSAVFCVQQQKHI